MQETLPIHFAPLQGYTEVFYRNAHAACFGGVDTYYTPFVRIEKGEFRRKDVRGIEPENNHVPHLVPQLIAPTAESGLPLSNISKASQWFRHPALSRRSGSTAQRGSEVSANQFLHKNEIGMGECG